MQRIDHYLNAEEQAQMTAIRAKAFARVVAETARALKPSVDTGDGRVKCDLLEELAGAFVAQVENPRGY